jgi:hypothetical protein
MTGNLFKITFIPDVSFKKYTQHPLINTLSHERKDKFMLKNIKVNFRSYCDRADICWCEYAGTRKSASC